MCLQIKYLIYMYKQVFFLFGFYGISIFIGYVMSNPFLYK